MQISALDHFSWCAIIYLKAYLQTPQKHIASFSMCMKWQHQVPKLHRADYSSARYRCLADSSKVLHKDGFQKHFQISSVLVEARFCHRLGIACIRKNIRSNDWFLVHCMLLAFHWKTHASERSRVLIMFTNSRLTLETLYMSAVRRTYTCVLQPILKI